MLVPGEIYSKFVLLPVNVLSQLLGGTRLPYSSSFPWLQKYHSLFPRLGFFLARLDVWNQSCFSKIDQQLNSLDAGFQTHLCGSMIQRNIQNDPQVPTMCLSNQELKILHGPVNRIDLSIIANIIPKITLCWLNLLCEPFKTETLTPYQSSETHKLAITR